MPEALFIAKNSKTVGWCLKRLQRTMKRDKHHVCLLQNPAIYYAGSCAKRGHTIARFERGEELEKSMEEVVAAGWIRYLVDEHGFNAPAWLTLDLLGSVTISGNGDKAFFGQKQDIHNDAGGRRRRKSPGRRRFEEMRRAIRAEWTPVITKHMHRLKEQEQEQEQPRSDTDMEDTMYAVHKDMWRLTSRSSRVVMKMSEYERRCAHGEELELVQEKMNPETLQDIECRGYPGGSPGGGNPDYAPDSESDPESYGGSNEGGTSQRTEGKSRSVPPEQSIPTPDFVTDVAVNEKTTIPDANLANPDEATQVTTSASADDKDVQVWLPMPDSWLHQYSLVVATFSSLAEEPFPTLKLLPSNAPEVANERVRGGGDVDSGDDGSVDHALPSAGASGSVAASNKLPSRVTDAIGHVDKAPRFQAEALRLIEEGRNDLRGEQMASSVAAMARFMMEDLAETRQAKREDRALKRRDREASELREIIKLHEELGDRSEAVAKKRQLIRLLSTPLVPIAVESDRIAGADSRAAGSAGGGTGGRTVSGGESGALRIRNETEGDSVVAVKENGRLAMDGVESVPPGKP